MTTLSIGARSSLPKVASVPAEGWFISACRAGLRLLGAPRARRRRPATKRSWARGGREAPEAQHPKGPILHHPSPWRPAVGKKRTHIKAFEEADTVNGCSALTYRGGGARCKGRTGEDVMLRKRNLKHPDV
ncbi:unnamed protein product [Arctogadus glacialis]